MCVTITNGGELGYIELDPNDELDGSSFIEVVTPHFRDTCPEFLPVLFLFSCIYLFIILLLFCIKPIFSGLRVSPSLNPGLDPSVTTQFDPPSN